MERFVWSDVIEKKAVEIFKDLIRINTSNPPGNEEIAAKYIEKVFMEKGIESFLIEDMKGRTNIVAKIKGGKNSPVVLISHLDVVPADEEKWVHPPFEAVEEEGIIWGRGTLDTKQLTAMQMAAFMMLKEQESFLNRDIYFIASADEETGSKHGMELLTKKMPEIFKSNLVISEGGGFPVSLKGRSYMLCAAGEKGICRVKLSSEGETGHSSCPPDNQALVSMADALYRLTNYCFERKYTAISKQFTLETGLNPNSNSVNDSTLSNLLEYMLYDGLIINKIDAGQRINVIPQRAEAELEYRILPGTTIDEIEFILKKSLEDVNVKWEITAFETGYESSINCEIIKYFEENIRYFGFEGKILPIVALGRTDGRFFRLSGTNIYGISPVLFHDNFTEVLKRVHNHNERIGRDSYVFGAKVMAKTLFDLCVE